MIKLFACDLDGTLLNEQNQSDEIILKAINKVIDNNLAFAVATGRDFNEYMRDTSLSQLKVYTIFMNGAYIANDKNEIIFKKSLNKQFIKQLLLEFPNVDFDCINAKATYTISSREDYLKQFSSLKVWQKKNYSKEKIESLVSHFIFGYPLEQILAQDILKINFIVEDQDLRKQLDDFIEKNSHLVANAPFEPGFYELTDRSVNKGNAIMFLANYLQIKPDEVAVYGDGLNDLDMLKMFEHSYAPANALDEAKQCANHVIGHHKNHAVALHIEKTIG